MAEDFDHPRVNYVLAHKDQFGSDVVAVADMIVTGKTPGYTIKEYPPNQTRIDVATIGGPIDTVIITASEWVIDHPEDAPSPTEPEPGQDDTPTQSSATRKLNKANGIPHGAQVKIKNKQATDTQIDEVNKALDVAVRYEDVDEAMVIALLCAGIGESSFQAIMNQGHPPSGYGGVFQGDVDNGTNGRVWAGKMHDTEGMAKCFLFGGKGFQPPTAPDPAIKHGGCYYWHKKHPDWGPGSLVVSVQGSGSNFPGGAGGDVAEHFYGQWSSEAQALWEAYGGGIPGGATFYRKQFNFEIGSDSQPHESYWDGMLRLAQDVNWRLFIDGRTIYFDSDFSLIQQQPSLVLSRGDPRVLRWSATWDDRKIATEMSINLVCEPFEFRAGEVFLLQSWGPLSTGSTAKLPGRWLVSRISRSGTDLYSTITLTQPEKPKLEADPGKGQRKVDEDIHGKGLQGIHDDMTPREVIDTLVLPIGRAHELTTSQGLTLNSDNVKKANDDHPQNVSGGGGTSWHKGTGFDTWAVDIADGGEQQPTKHMDACAKELIESFELPDLADWHAELSDGEVSGNLVVKDWPDKNPKYKFQLIYRTNLSVGGNHYNHVHFGVKWLPNIPRRNQP